MKDTEVKRTLYQDSEAFKAGIEVGRKEVIEKAYEYLLSNIDKDLIIYNDTSWKNLIEFAEDFRNAMLEEEYLCGLQGMQTVL